MFIVTPEDRGMIHRMKYHNHHHPTSKMPLCTRMRQKGVPPQHTWHVIPNTLVSGQGTPPHQEL